MTVNHFTHWTRTRQFFLFKEIGKLFSDHIEYVLCEIVLEDGLLAVYLGLLQLEHFMILLYLLFEHHVLLITYLLGINSFL